MGGMDKVSKADKKIHILVVDDHALFRRGVISLLTEVSDFSVVGQAGDANEAIKLSESLKPDVVLLDNHLPGASGIQSIKDIVQASPESSIIILTVSEDEADLTQALKNGAQGYFLKTIERDDLIAGIRKANDGESVISAEMTHKLVAAFKTGRENSAPKEPKLSDDLSAREYEIVCCIARGLSNKEIARELGIAETTVKIHVRHILQKLNLASRVQVAVFASSEGLCDDASR
jgi:two-component system nitrate/nitrite response regulator NarL